MFHSISRASYRLAFLALAGAVLLTNPSSQAGAQNAPDLANIEPGKVLVLGTWHFSNPGRDMFNTVAEDVTTPEHQEELQRLAEALARFKPTHIAIEGDVDEPVYGERYAAYLAGKAELNHNERQQIGFRLAKMLGHEKVYPVDHNQGLEAGIEGDIFEHINRFPDVWEALNEVGSKDTEKQNELIKSLSIPQMLRLKNTREALDNGHDAYARYFMVMGGADHIPGPKMVANWYERNLYITHNLLQLYEGPETRILAIYGSGHAYLLDQMLRESPFYDVVDPLDYIPEE